MYVACMLNSKFVTFVPYMSHVYFKWPMPRFMDTCSIHAGMYRAYISKYVCPIHVGMYRAYIFKYICTIHAHMHRAYIFEYVCPLHACLYISFIFKCSQHIKQHFEKFQLNYILHLWNHFLITFSEEYEIFFLKYKITYFSLK